jgi:TetR/AcrR family transcriptional repressor of nem operon
MHEKVDAKTRSAIVEASMNLFARRGYHGTSIAQIAQATGLTKGALYWYFKGKEELFLTVLDTIREKWQETVMAKVEAIQGTVQKLEQLFDATSEMVAAENTPFSMHLFLVSAGAQPEMREFEEAIRAAYAGYVKIIADTIKTGQEEGEVRRDADAESVAVGLIGCLEGIVLQARLHSPATITAAIAEMKREFVRSLCLIPTRAPKREKPEKIVSLAADQLHLF